MCFDHNSHRCPETHILKKLDYKYNKSVCYINHHYEKTNKDSVESENVSKAFDTFLKAVLMYVKIPNPNGTHNNGH